MAFVAVLLDTLHAALEDRVISLDRVGVASSRTYSARVCSTVWWSASVLPTVT